MIALDREQHALTIAVGAPVRYWTLVVIALAVGLALRLVGLASRPLQPWESPGALEAYRLTRGMLEGYQTGPLPTNIRGLLFVLFGDGDLTARLPDLLAGIGLCAVPLLVVGLRPQARLFATVLVAASSVALFTSREGAGASLVALLAALALVSLWNSTRERRSLWPIVFAATLGLGVASDPAFLVTTVVSVVAIVAALRLGKIELYFASWRTVAPGWMVAIAAGSFLGGATLLGTSPFGLQAALSNLWRWPGDFLLGQPSRLLGVLFDDPALLLLGCLGAVLAIRRDEILPRLAVALAVGQLLLVVICRAPDLRYLAMLLLPFGLLGGVGLAGMWDSLVSQPSRRAWWLALLLFVPFIFLEISAIQAATLAKPLSPFVPIFAAASLGLIVLFGTAVYLPSELRSAGLVAALVALAVLEVRGIATLNIAPPAATTSLLRREAVLPSIHQVADLATLWDRADPEGSLVVDDRLRPLLDWELRGIGSVSYQQPVNAPPGAAILSGQASPTLLAGKQVERFPVRERDRGVSWRGSPSAFLRWFLTRESLEDPDTDAILAAR